jgi:hypothetical protein
MPPETREVDRGRTLSPRRWRGGEEGRSNAEDADAEGGEGGGADKLGKGQHRGEVAAADPVTERSGIMVGMKETSFLLSHQLLIYLKLNIMC